MDYKKVLWHFNLKIKKVLFNSVGKSCYMGPTVSLIGTKNISIGDRVRIYPGSRMEVHNNGAIVIQDDCSIAQNFHVTSGEGTLIIGSGTTISGNVFITNIDHEYREIDKHIMEQPIMYKETIIGENCFIGYGASIQAGTKLGKHCVVGTNAVVRGEYPDYSVIVGVPGRIIKRYNKESREWERV